MIIWGIFGVQSRVCTGEGAGVWACSVGGYRDRRHPAPAAGPTWQVLLKLSVKWSVKISVKIYPPKYWGESTFSRFSNREWEKRPQNRDGWGRCWRKWLLSGKEMRCALLIYFLKSSHNVWKSIIGRFSNREWAKKSQHHVYMIKFSRCAGLTIKKFYKKKAYIF